MERALVLLLPIFTCVNCGNVLVILPVASPSHKNIFEPIYCGLAERGHNITVVTSLKPNKPQQNVRSIIPFENMNMFPGKSPLDLRKMGVMGTINVDYSFVVNSCEAVYNSTEFMQLLDEKFDLVLMLAYFHECLLGFVHRLGAPLILVSPMPVMSLHTLYIGNRLPPSFVREMLLHYSHRMTFLERAVNVVVNFLFYFGARKKFHLHETISRKYLGEDVPSVDSIVENTSMIFSNEHFSFNFPRPHLPDLVGIGGVHCRLGRRLPKELDDFVSGAQDGLVLFSLGTIVKPHEMPEETRKAFLEVFSRLKQRVLWKWPTPMNDLPPNVMLSAWVPQQDVLAHPNTRLFVTHAGLLSTQEAIYHGVPMVAIPIFGDQNSNAYTATQAGISETLEILGLKEEDIERAITMVLNNKSYTENVKLMSKYFRDQPDTPKERAIFWAEYVIRHMGAPQLRSAARELNFFQYHCIDVIAVLAILTGSLAAVMYFVLRSALRMLMSFSNATGDKKKKQ